MSESALAVEEEDLTDLSEDEALAAAWAENEEAREPAPVDDVAVEKEAAEVVATEGEDLGEADDPALEPMHHWRPEVKEVFSTMNRAQQEERIGREREFEQGIQHKSAELNTHKQINGEIQGMLSPLAQGWERQGVSPTQGLKRMVALENDLNTDPGAALIRMAQQYGVNLEQQFQDEPYVDPQTRQYQSDLKALQDKWSDFEKTQEQTAQQSQQDASNNAISQIKAFASSADEQGNLKYPYVKDKMVMDMMGQAFMSGHAPDLHTAYEAAMAQLRAHPVFKAQAQTTSADTQARVDRAKGASKVVTTKKVGSNALPDDEDASILAMLEEQGLE